MLFGKNPRNSVILPSFSVGKAKFRAFLPETPYSGSNASYLNKEVSYPWKEVSYPDKETSYPGKEASYLNKETSYQYKEDSYPNKDVSYPYKEASYPGKDASYPNKEAFYPGSENTANLVVVRVVKNHSCVCRNIASSPLLFSVPTHGKIEKWQMKKALRRARR